jgi:UDP-N-acetyl-D-glucosamine dehydrogenase
VSHQEAKIVRAKRPANHELLASKIMDGKAEIAVLGLGYVGLPLAVAFAQEGFSVCGIDVDADRVEQVRGGRSYVSDVISDRLDEVVKTGRFRATTDFALLARADVVLICVPTPMNKSREPDISYIRLAATHTQQYLRPGQLVILESTTYPGTTEEMLLPLLEQTGLTLDEDFYLAYSPERIDPGNPNYRLREIPKIVGGVSRISGDLAEQLYRRIVVTVHRVSSARVAEAAKLLENTFRAVNIALANEFALLCRALSMDVWEVIAAAATKPFGFLPFYPGPGIGGHCIPVDPGYLAWKARVHGFEPRLIGVAQEINSLMPHYIVDLVAEALNARAKPVKGSRVLVLGVAYKRNVADVRESPALAIMEELQGRGAIISYSDPHVPQVTINSQLLTSTSLSDDLVAAADCVLIHTDHAAFDYRRIVEQASLVVDVRNATGDLGRWPHVVRL